MSTGKLFISILLLSVIVACGETRDAFYKNIYEAIEHGAVERGWIPDILPKSSYEIYERHDLDTNTVWLRFKFNKQDINELIAQIEEVKPDEIRAIALGEMRDAVNYLTFVFNEGVRYFV